METVLIIICVVLGIVLWSIFGRGEWTSDSLPFLVFGGSCLMQLVIIAAIVGVGYFLFEMFLG